MKTFHSIGYPLLRVFLCAVIFNFQFSIFNPLQAQVAGMSSLAVLNTPGSARTSALGFNYLSMYDDDIALALDNPSLVSDRISNQLAVSFVNMFAGANFGSVAYAYNFENLGAFTFGLQFGSYGLFQGYDETDQETWDFMAADYVLTVGWGRALNENVTIGANFRPILSQYESYTALAFGIDLAGTFMTNDKNFSSTVMARNIGAQIFTFDGTTERLPFEIAIAGSYKLKEAPFRLMFALNELQTWDLRYEDPLNPSTVTDPFTGETTQKHSKFVNVLDNLGRHINVGFEVDIKQIVFLRVGYSYRQMAEMRAADTFNMSGFSYGVGVKVKGFELSYARNNYHLMQAPNFISISTDLDRFFR